MSIEHACYSFNGKFNMGKTLWKQIKIISNIEVLCVKITLDETSSVENIYTTILNKFIIFHIPEQCALYTIAVCVCVCLALDLSALTTANCTDKKSLMIKHETTAEKKIQKKNRMNQAMIHLLFAIVLPTKVPTNNSFLLHSQCIRALQT